MFSGADDDLSLISQYYQTESSYTQFVPEQFEVGNSKPRRRRKKNKSDDDGAMRKRKLTQEQVNMLEQYFGSERKLESERKDKLALELGLDPRQVAVWFQNRRARWKTKKLEEEYSKLKTEHDNTVIEKCHLESELLKLKERLVEAEQEVQRLSSRCDLFSANSPNSSFVSMEVTEPPYLREFDMNGFGNVLIEAQNSYINGVEWDSSLYYTTTM